MDHQCVNTAWGIHPILMQWGNIEISSYTAFVVFGLIAGGIVYFKEARKQKQFNELSFLIVIGAIVGSALGSKLLELLINIDRIESKSDLLTFLMSGRTIIGGLIGGTIGVWMTKRFVGIRQKRGNLFAPAVALGVAVGRVGCFFNGCCYGQETHLPWGIDFGDGIYRHPTQLYESAFMLICFFALKYRLSRGEVLPGYLFKLLMIVYFVFRFTIEFIRVERMGFAGLTYFQVIALFVLFYLVLSDKGLILQQITTYGKSKIKRIL